MAVESSFASSNTDGKLWVAAVPVMTPDTTPPYAHNGESATIDAFLPNLAAKLQIVDVFEHNQFTKPRPGSTHLLSDSRIVKRTTLPVYSPFAVVSLVASFVPCVA
jgi:hypothetical protein